jgi:hypothetical protein
MHRPARLVFAPAALLLALTACSSSTDDSGGEAKSSSSPSTGASLSSSPEPSATASAPPEPAVLDPCQMVPEETWQQLLPAKRRDHVVLKRLFTTTSGILIQDTRVRYACAVTFDDSDDSPVIWGYYPGTFTADDLRKLLDAAGGTEITNQLGFPAVTTGDFGSSDAYGIVGSTGLFVTILEELDSVVTGDRTKKKVPIAMLRALGEQVDPTEPQPERLLPDFCPAVDSPELVAVHARVDVGRGGDDGQGHQWCLYRDVRAGSDLRLEAYHFTDEYFQTFYDQTKGNPNGVDMFDGPPGMIRMISLGEDGSADSIVLDPDSHYYVDANLEYQQSKHRTVDGKAFIALAAVVFESVSTAATDD